MADKPVTLSVLDRLISSGPTGSYRRESSVIAYESAVRRDLEWLLNTRRTPERLLVDNPGYEQPEEYVAKHYPQAQHSVINFGIPDVTSLHGESLTVKRLLARDIKDAIEVFEPRLGQVRVVWSGDGDQAGDKGVDPHKLRFRIEAVLKMDPSPIRVSFDAVLDSVQGEFELEGGSDAA